MQEMISYLVTSQICVYSVLLTQRVGAVCIQIMMLILKHVVPHQVRICMQDTMAKRTQQVVLVI